LSGGKNSPGSIGNRKFQLDDIFMFMVGFVTVNMIELDRITADLQVMLFGIVIK